ncbi:P-loop-containing protein [Streptomyces sp. DSM 42041]|uniref:P-loop-containing protein n=1 Tax=Streptomyces hazeniae TaxID=3075538 RepID=A0ABU2NJS8_9ACTN|nr:P-loop-containing protein [Streptomyces sp. DSM 42041]MDT0377250.1 P-loop-containing protein [Streptomyces sp. DSM 42041]
MTTHTRAGRPRLLYLIGPPAAGKSALAAALRHGHDLAARDQPVPHLLLIDPATGQPAGIELGRIRDRFSGTDALPMNVHLRACDWIENGPVWPFVLAEGARLATRGFLTAAHARYSVHLAHLHADPALLDQRCAERGSRQDDRWRRGAATRARNLAAWAETQPWITLHHLDAAAPTADHTAALRLHITKEEAPA